MPADTARPHVHHDHSGGALEAILKSFLAPRRRDDRGPERGERGFEGDQIRLPLGHDAADPWVAAVLVTGAGRGFSSGADLKEGFDPAEDGMPDVRKELHELYHPIIAGVRRLEKPVVAAVNGPAVGIGASFAFAC